MQVAGLSPLTGVLAIGLPYAGIFAKVFAEIMEEADTEAVAVLPAGTGALSAFAFARLPVLAARLGAYVGYRLECGLRSTLVLGFIGLPTLGFDLDGYFRVGDYREAAALLLMFYALIGTRGVWARTWTAPLLVAGSLLVLPGSTGSGDVLGNLHRLLAHDVVPAPLRAQGGWADPQAWGRTAGWLGSVLAHQVLPGAARTLVLSQMAVVASGLLALALFPLACRRFGGAGRQVGRLALLLARATPDYMVAYVLLQALGPSMLPAVIALALHNGGIVAFLLGSQADALPLRADAPHRRLDLYAWEVLPRLYGQFVALTLYRWEIIMRESAIMGLLGVRTLGYYVDASISELRLDETLVLIGAMVLLSMGTDTLSRRLRGVPRVRERPGQDDAWRQDTMIGARQ